LLLCSLLLVGAAYTWSARQRQQIAHYQEQACLAARRGQHQVALEHYATSFKLHQQIFDRNGQVEDLIAQSRCFSAQGRFEEALGRLQQAERIKPFADVQLAQAGVHRQLGVRALDQASQALEDLEFEQALALADQSLSSLEAGQGSPAQRAAAHRVAALALARARKLDQAEARLALAVELQGPTSANRAAAVQVEKLEAELKMQRELAWKREKAAERAALEKARRNRPAEPVLARVVRPKAARYVSDLPPLPTWSYARQPAPMPAPVYPVYQPPSEHPSSSGLPTQALPFTSNPRPSIPSVRSIPSFPRF
jgi:tetratricopeptide (TPR) repeat protein